MKQNELIEKAAADRHRPYGYSCRVCGSPASTYNCNAALGEQRPEAYGVWDWWVACDNAECINAHGDGYFQGLPWWVARPKRAGGHYTPGDGP